MCRDIWGNGLKITEMVVDGESCLLVLLWVLCQMLRKNWYFEREWCRTGIFGSGWVHLTSQVVYRLNGFWGSSVCPISQRDFKKEYEWRQVVHAVWSLGTEYVSNIMYQQLFSSQQAYKTKNYASSSGLLHFFRQNIKWRDWCVGNRILPNL